LLPLVILGWQNTDAASLTTDRLDYPPFSDVTITGTGFAPGEVVAVQVDEVFSDGSRVNVWIADPSPVADVTGTFSVVWYIWSDEFIGSTLEAVATGPISGTVTATFTDAVGINLDQFANGGAVDTSPGWSNGSLNGNNSTYQETESVPFRFFVTDLGSNSTHFVTIQAEWTKGVTTLMIISLHMTAQKLRRSQPRVDLYQTPTLQPPRTNRLRSP
jgi:hypothetical protein